MIWMRKALKAVCVVLAVSLLAGCVQLIYVRGTLDQTNKEFQETAKQMQTALDDSELDLYTDTLNYDTYKAALNSELYSLNEGEQVAYINVGFGSLDRGLKYVNDNYGHLNGGPTIQAFAELLKQVFPEKEGWVIAHRGGSSFLAFCRGQYDEKKLLSYYKQLKKQWHDTPYQVPNGEGVIKGMALLYLATVGPECGADFSELREQLVYKKLALRDITNCGYVIQTAPDHYISSVEIDESAYMEG